MKEAIQYHIFKQVQDNPEITQRELAAKTGLSLLARFNATKWPCCRQDLTRG